MPVFGGACQTAHVPAQQPLHRCAHPGHPRNSGALSVLRAMPFLPSCFAISARWQRCSTWAPHGISLRIAMSTLRKRGLPSPDGPKTQSNSIPAKAARGPKGTADAVVTAAAAASGPASEGAVETPPSGGAAGKKRSRKLPQDIGIPALLLGGGMPPSASAAAEVADAVDQLPLGAAGLTPQSLQAACDFLAKADPSK